MSSGCMTATPIIWREERTRLFWSISLIFDWVSASMRRLQPGSSLYQSSWDQRLSLIEASSLSNLSDSSDSNRSNRS